MIYREAKRQAKTGAKDSMKEQEPFSGIGKDTFKKILKFKET